MRDLLHRSASGNAADPEPNTSAPLVAAWWLLLLVSRSVDRFAMRTIQRAEEFEAWRLGYRASLVGTVLAIVAGLLACLMLRRIQASQREVLGRAPTQAGAG